MEGEDAGVRGRDSVSACEVGEGGKVTRLMRRKRVVGVFIFKK